MTFSIDEINSAINGAGGLMSPNRFSLIITPPSWSSSQNESRLIEIFADSCDMPGLTFGTNDVKNLGYGPTFKLPHTPIYTDVSASIMLDNNGTILGFFQKWMQNIVNINSDGSPETSGYNSARMYAVQYPSNYTTTVTILLYDKEANTIIFYMLNDAYPIALGQPRLDWSANNQVLRLPVTFTFRTWTSTLFEANDQTLGNSIASFDPYASSLSGSLWDASTYSYMSTTDILTASAISLINNAGNYASNVLKIFT